jgi:hypothetical protein
MKHSHIIAIVTSILLGSAYYIMMESSIPTEANCSYLATPMTDYLAFVWGFIVSKYGIEYDNPILTGLGMTVIVEHVWQLQHKGIKQMRRKSV